MSDIAGPLSQLASLHLPVRTLEITCETSAPFELPLGETLEPHYVWRGLIGAALTETSPELARRLFKPTPLGEAATPDESEPPTTPWRLRLSHLYARTVPARFHFSIDIIGEEPCDLADSLVEAIRLAGSGKPYRDWRGRDTTFGLALRDEDGFPQRRITFDVVRAESTQPIPLDQNCTRRAPAWESATGAMLLLRTLTVLTSRDAEVPAGVPLAVAGELDAATLVGNALRRLIVLDFVTRRNPAERQWRALRAALAEQEAALAAVAAECSLRCADAITVPVQRHSRQQPQLRGLIGSARFTGGPLLPWLPGFLTCELLGIGESTAYGAGQTAWLPIS